jgi:hypothetical protein
MHTCMSLDLVFIGFFVGTAYLFASLAFASSANESWGLRMLAKALGLLKRVVMGEAHHRIRKG